VTALLLLTEPSRKEVLLVRRNNPLGPLEYGLLGQSWDEPAGHADVAVMLAERISHEELANSVGESFDREPLVKEGKVTVYQAIATDWKAWRRWCFLAMQGGMTPEALWMCIEAVKRMMSGEQSHSCYRQTPRDNMTTLGIQAFLDTVKALEMARLFFAGPHDMVRLKGKVLEVEVPNVKQFDKQRSKARGILPWLPKGMSVEVVLSATAEEGAVA